MEKFSDQQVDLLMIVKFMTTEDISLGFIVKRNQ
jgi:hypothetical protein